MSPAEFGKLIADETEKWAKLLRAANIKLEQSAWSAAKCHTVPLPAVVESI